jgi:hypothetical protein
MSAFDPKRTLPPSYATFMNAAAKSKFFGRFFGVSKITKQTLGVDVSPHLFRMAAATLGATAPLFVGAASS